MAGPDVIETIDPTTGNITTTTTIVDPVTGDGTSTSITVDQFGQEIAKSTSGSSTNPATGDMTLTIETTDLTTGVTTTHQTVTDANGNQKLDFDRTDNPGGTSHETGTQVDPTGAITTEYTIDRMKNPDGSSTFTRTDQSSDGSSSRSEGGKDAEGNSSVTTRLEEADGGVVLMTRTVDKDGNGTEHRTRLDPDGTIRSDGIFDVVDGVLQPDPVPVDPDPVDPDPDPVDPDPDPVDPDPDPDPVDPDPDPVDPDPVDPFPDPVDPDPFPDPVDPGPFPGPSGPGGPDPLPDPGELVVIDPFDPHKVPEKLPAENFLRRVSEPSYRSADVLVYDDVLPEPAFSRLFRHLGSLDYSSVHRSGWRKVWRLHDGDPLRARTTWYRPGEDEGTEDFYPAGAAVDELISWITDRQDDIATVVGTAGAEWEKISFTPWIYPVGSGLSLHQDGTTYSGAFTYFAHREWRLHWGGHLMVMDSRTRSRLASPGESGPAAFDDRQESLRAFDPGFALTIFPKPNRVVFLSPRAMHLLTRVDTNAGQQARISVAGFFHRRPPNRPTAAHRPQTGRAADPGSRGYGRPWPADRVR